jgi:hypothetical protein
MYHLWRKLEGERIINRFCSVLSFLFLPYIAGFDNVKKGDVFVFSNISIKFLPICFLKKIRLHGGKIVIFSLDSLSNVFGQKAYNKIRKFKFDLVYTFDKNDAEDHDFIFYPSIYSKIVMDNSKILYDWEFIGSNKGRLDILKDIAKQCKDCNMYVDVFGVKEKDQVNNGFRYNLDINYKDTLRIVQQSNCIIDIVIDPNQSGLSLRAYEAVAYNKKLITNNRSILFFPFYDKKYMKYVKDFRNIDSAFIKERITVDYGYKGEFSPLHFISDIKRRLSLKD